MEAVFAVRDSNLFQEAASPKTFYYPTTPTRTGGKKQDSMEAVSRRKWVQDNLSSPPSANSSSSPQSCGDVVWDVKVASPEVANGAGSGSPGSSKFDETWPSRSEEGKGFDSEACEGGAASGGKQASSSAGVVQDLDEGVVVSSGDKDLERRGDTECGGSTLAKYINRFRKAPPTSRRHRELSDQQFWWREEKKEEASSMKERGCEHSEDKGLPHGNDSSPRVSSTPNSLLSRSQDVLEKSSSLFQVSPLESPPAQKYWNRRPKATSDGKLADPYRLTRPTRTGIGRKTARDEFLSPSSDILVQWRLRRRLEQARREPVMLTQHEGGSGTAARSGDLPSVSSKFEKRVSMEIRLGCKEERLPVGETRIVGIEKGGGRLVDQPRIASGVEGVGKSGGSGTVSVREAEVQTSPQHLSKEGDEEGLMSHPCCGAMPLAGGGAARHTCGSEACAVHAALVTCHECGKEIQEPGLQEAPPSSETCMVQDLRSSHPVPSSGPSSLSRSLGHGIMGQTLLGKLTQSLEQGASAGDNHGRNLEASSLADEDGKLLSEKHVKALPPHGGLALRCHASLSSDESEEILGLSFAMADSSCRETTTATSRAAISRAQAQPSSSPDTSRKQLDTQPAQGSLLLSLSQDTWQDRKTIPQATPTSRESLSLPPPSSGGGCEYALCEPHSEHTCARGSSKTDDLLPQKTGECSLEALAEPLLECCTEGDELLELLTTKARLFEAQIRDIDRLLMALEPGGKRPNLSSTPARSPDPSD